MEKIVPYSLQVVGPTMSYSLNNNYCSGTGPLVYIPFLRTLESPSIGKCDYKCSTFSVTI